MELSMFLEFPGVLITIGVALLLLSIIIVIIAYATADKKVVIKASKKGKNNNVKTDITGNNGPTLTNNFDVGLNDYQAPVNTNTNSENKNVNNVISGINNYGNRNENSNINNNTIFNNLDNNANNLNNDVNSVYNRTIPNFNSNYVESPIHNNYNKQDINQNMPKQNFMEKEEETEPTIDVFEQEFGPYKDETPKSNVIYDRPYLEESPKHTVTNSYKNNIFDKLRESEPEPKKEPETSFIDQIKKEEEEEIELL